MSDEPSGAGRPAQLIPLVYQDLAAPAVREVGKTVHGLVRAALSPANLAVWTFDQACEWAQGAVAKRLRWVPPERLVAPAAAVAGPALEALRLAGPDPALRELFANLLATAVDADTAAVAHPAFVEILRQLAPDEARIVSLLGRAGSVSLTQWDGDDRARYADGRLVSEARVSEAFTGLAARAGCVAPHLGAAYVGNVRRLGLLDVREVGRERGPYDHGWDREARAELTAFGTQFYRACVEAREEAADDVA